MMVIQRLLPAVTVNKRVCNLVPNLFLSREKDRGWVWSGGTHILGGNKETKRACLFVCSFVYSFICLFVCLPFVYLFIYLLIC